MRPIQGRAYLSHFALDQYRLLESLPSRPNVASCSTTRVKAKAGLCKGVNEIQSSCESRLILVVARSSPQRSVEQRTSNKKPAFPSIVRQGNAGQYTRRDSNPQPSVPKVRSGTKFAVSFSRQKLLKNKGSNVQILHSFRTISMSSRTLLGRFFAATK